LILTEGSTLGIGHGKHLRQTIRSAVAHPHRQRDRTAVASTRRPQAVRVPLQLLIDGQPSDDPLCCRPVSQVAAASGLPIARTTVNAVHIAALPA